MMPTTIRYLDRPAGTRFATSDVSGNRDAQNAVVAAVMAWAVIMLMVFAAAPSSPEATEMDPFQLLATF